MEHAHAEAASVLHALDEIGAISLDKLIGSAEEVRKVVGQLDIDDPDRGICYPFVIRIGPRQDIDLVTIAADVKKLGFELNRVGR